MAEFTENLNLEMPDKIEQYNVAVQNSNMKKIDDFSKLTPPRALTADKLTSGAKINNVFFDGTQDIVLDGFNDSLTYKNITNCITEIPQRIKLELNNGTLTLKAGSIVTVPNGFEADGTTPKFDYVTIESDSTVKNGANQQEIILSENGNITGGVPSAWTYSGATQPTVSTTFAIWYDTANNKIKLTINKGSTWLEGLSLPIALATSSTTQYTSIDQVFNGIGYIGKRFWLDKDVKMLISDGRNDNGTLKNKEITLNNIAFGDAYDASSGYRYNAYYPSFNGINNIFAQNTLQGLKIDRPTDISTTDSRWYYATDENKWYFAGVGGDWQQLDLIVLNSYYWDKNKQQVTEYKQKKYTFQALDYSDKSQIGSWAMPSDKYIDLTLGASGTTYTAPVNGYFSAYVQLSNSNASYIGMYNSSKHPIGTTLVGTSAGNSYKRIYVPVAKGDICMVTHTGITTAEKSFRFYYAQGEV